MKTTDAIKIFKNKAGLARALGVSRPTISNWGDIIPPLQQLKLESITKGALQAEPGIPRGYVTIRKPRRLVIPENK